MDISVKTDSSVADFVNSTVSSAKNAVELAKNSKDSALKEKVSEVFDGVLDLKRAMLDLEDENRSLRGKLAERQKLKRDPLFGYWFKDGESDPLCPKCFEGDEKIVYLPPVVEWANGSLHRRCRVCNSDHTERKGNSASRQVISRGVNSWQY